jgi:hypothetical protein
VIEQLPTTQQPDAFDAIMRAFFIGALVGFIGAVFLTAAIFIAHMAHHDRMFHTPKQEAKP